MRTRHWLWVFWGISVAGVAAAAAEAPQEETEPAPTLQGAADRIATALELQISDQSTARQVEIAEQDLLTQRDMAKWAERMFWAAVASVLLTVIGVVLLWRTLVYTKKTLKEAETTSAATLRAVDSTRRLERPYIFETITTQESAFPSLFQTFRKTNRDDLYPRIDYTITNHGKTPAVVTEYAIGSDVNIGSDHPVYSGQRHDSPFVLLPGESKAQFFIAEHHSISSGNLEDFERGKRPINFYAKIIYEDVFGDSHTTAFYWRYMSGLGFAPYHDPKANKNYRT